MGWFLFCIFLICILVFNSKNKRKKLETSNRQISRAKSAASHNITTDKVQERASGVNQNSWQLEHEDDLATIVISANYEVSQKNRRVSNLPARWIKNNDVIEIYGRKITKGFFYYGDDLESGNGFYSEPSLVDPLLEVTNSMNRMAGEIGYWPSYEHISSGERGTYLDWLASDRKDVSFGISYIFIYFYGLERRVVVDSQKIGLVSDAEFIEIFEEVKRLNHLFSHNYSFNGYSSHLMGVMHLLRPNIVLFEDIEIVEFSVPLFKIKLSNCAIQGEPIPVDIAYDWLTKFSEYRLLTPAQRCNTEFRELFKIEFSKKFPNGFIVKPNKTPLKLGERFASIGLSNRHIELGFMPDITALISPVKNQLIPIADVCTKKLDAYSRYLGKDGTSRSDINALTLLPPELLKNGNNQFSKLQKTLEVRVKSTDGIVCIDELWDIFELEKPERINKKEVELLQTISQLLGYGYAPDERYHGIRIKHSENIVLYDMGEFETFVPSMYFQEMILSLRLGALVALIDDQLDINEVNYLTSLIADNDHFSNSEKASLNAYLKWCLNNKPNLSGLKARVENFGDKEIESIRSAIINVVLADGESSPEEIKQVEKIYRSLNLDPALAIKDIHEQSTSAVSRKILRELNSRGAMLDYAVLAQHKEDTRNVQSMLQEIFADDEDAEHLIEINDGSNDEPETPVEINEDGSGLDLTHLNIYQRLVSKETWEKEEMIALGAEFCIMINGAIETINDWAFELIGAPIVEGNGPYYIDLEIVEEIEEEREKVCR